MKTEHSLLKLIRDQTSPHKFKKQNHSQYFESLEEKLIKQSEKISTLINLSSPSLSKTLKGSLKHTKKNYEWIHLPPKPEDHHNTHLKDRVSPTHALIQKYLEDKKKTLNNSRSQYFNKLKEQQHYQERKLMYNYGKDNEPHENSKNNQQQQNSISEQLKFTASTTNSSANLLKTIEKIKTMTELSRKSSQKSSCRSKRTKQLKISDFQQGQFGSVYLARHILTNFICALKKVPKQLFSSHQRFVSQLIRQIKIQSHLDHPNIVQLYSFFDDPTHIYLILQYCSGSNLYNNLKKERRFVEQKVKHFTKHVCHAIEFMHDNDIIHRDIKPENILIHQGIIKICDFGWSIHSPLLRETRCGTPLYSSPEIVQKQQYDNKIDIWNIGILTYELIYGKVPFEIRSEEDLLKIVDQDIYFPKSIPVSSQAKNFILKCLKKDPKERISIAKLIDDEFLQD